MNLSILEFFDAKFYPYSPAGANPVFAAVSKKHVCSLSHVESYFTSPSDFKKQAVICRLRDTKEKDANPCEILQVIRDADVRSRRLCWPR